jgi:hypothetical protein
MYGRLGGMYLLHLTEAREQRRRLAQAGHPAGGAGAGRPAEGYGMFAWLVAVLTIAIAATAALATVVG